MRAVAALQAVDPYVAGIESVLISHFKPTRRALDKLAVVAALENAAAASGQLKARAAESAWVATTCIADR